MEIIIGNTTSNRLSETDFNNIYLSFPQPDNDELVIYYNRKEGCIEADYLFSLTLRVLEHEIIHIVLSNTISPYVSIMYDNISHLVDSL